MSSPQQTYRCYHTAEDSLYCLLTIRGRGVALDSTIARISRLAPAETFHDSASYPHVQEESR